MIWPVYQVDVQAAFLQRPIEGEVYVKMAPGQEETDSKTGSPMVMKLKLSLYGLAQSPSLWNGSIDTALGIGFTPTASDPCVYTYGRDNLAILTLCVDNILLNEANQKVVQR